MEIQKIQWSENRQYGWLMCGWLEDFPSVIEIEEGRLIRIGAVIQAGGFRCVNYCTMDCRVVVVVVS